VVLCVYLAQLVAAPCVSPCHLTSPNAALCPAGIPNPNFHDSLSGPIENGANAIVNCAGRADTWYAYKDACYLWVAQYGSYQLGWGCDASMTKPKYQQTENNCYWYNHRRVSGGGGGGWASRAASCVQPSCARHAGRHAMPCLR
jgi:hypothetical protein